MADITNTITNNDIVLTISLLEPRGGTVSSVQAVSTVTGLSFTGGPITDVGTLTLNGQVSDPNAIVYAIALG